MDISTFELSHLPHQENEQFEFKSSLTAPTELKRKLAISVSAFANSGGGTFVAGVNDATGDADGGLTVEAFVGKQRLLDWADQVIWGVTPVPRCQPKLVHASDGRGTIDEGKAVLIVSIEESRMGPHMAPDHRYYIRAGRHTVPAQQFFVEALWAMRHTSKPRMTHLIRQRPDYAEALQLGLVTLTDTPAIDVELAMEPLPGLYSQGCSEFPVRIGVIDQHAPFFFDVSTREQIRRRPDDEFVLKLTYYDLAGNAYRYENKINLFRSIPSLRFFKKDLDSVVAALDSIKEELARLSVNGRAIHEE